jgi:hypothetical protein
MLQLSGDLLSKGMLGAAAIALTFGAVQLASGRDLASQPSLAGTSGADVNRAAKADRAAGTAGLAGLTHTISLRFDSLANTSILIRVPVREARSRSPASLATRSGDHKAMLACEPVVSVLTEAFKQLQPGRCVT